MPANTIQLLVEHHIITGEGHWLALALLLAAVAGIISVVLLVKLWSRAIGLLASLEFATVILALIMIATAAGTLIRQQLPRDEFIEYYGSLATTMLSLHLDDLFRSYWFASLLGLLGASLLATAGLRIADLRAGKRRLHKQAGFLLLHLGIVVALLGGLVSRIGGDKGVTELVEGMTADRYLRRTTRPGGEMSAPLGFQVRLDEFNLEFYDPEYSTYLVRFTGRQNPLGHNEVESIAALTTDLGDRRLFGQRYEIEVVDFFLPPSIAQDSTPHVLIVDGHRIPVTPGSEVELDDDLTIEVLRFLPHFQYDIQSQRALSRSKRPDNPALYVIVRRRGVGEALYRSWLFGGRRHALPETHPARSDNEWAGRLAYEYARPSITLEIRDGEYQEQMTLQMGESRALVDLDPSYAVSFNQKGDRIKQYHSTVTIIDEGREVLSRAPLSVNHPIRYGGYHLYQSNYRWWDLSYSGLMVVRDPGLWIVYAGMAMMLAGLLEALYLRGRRRKRGALEARTNEVPGEETVAP